MGYNRDNFKLRFVSEPQFFINEKKGVVSCKLSAVLATPYEFLSPFIESKRFASVGLAYCSKDDKFDVNRGKRIALARAENQCYLEASSYLRENAKKLDFLLQGIDGFIDKAYGCCAHNDEYIDSLSYPANPNYQEVVYAPKKGVDLLYIKK